MAETLPNRILFLMLERALQWVAAEGHFLICHPVPKSF
jgi:hypothetical protein